MKSVPVRLDDDLDAALEAVCAQQGRSKTDLVGEILRKYLETERLRRELQDPDLVTLYRQLEGEDAAIADQGIAEYQEMLKAADQA